MWAALSSIGRPTFPIPGSGERAVISSDLNGLCRSIYTASFMVTGSRIHAGRQVVDLALDPVGPFAIGKGKILGSHLTIGDGRELAGFDQGPDGKAPVGVGDGLELVLDPGNGDQVVLALGSPEIGFQVDLLLPVLYIEIDLGRLGSGALDDVAKRDTTVEELEHIRDGVRCRHDDRLDHDPGLGTGHQLLNILLGTDQRRVSLVALAEDAKHAHGEPLELADSFRIPPGLPGEQISD